MKIKVSLLDSSETTLYREEGNVEIDNFGRGSYSLGSGTIDSSMPSKTIDEAFSQNRIKNLDYSLMTQSGQVVLSGSTLLTNVGKSYFAKNIVSPPRVNELNSVNINLAKNGSVLKYEQNSSKWVNSIDVIVDSNYYGRVIGFTGHSDTAAFTLVKTKINVDSCQFSNFSLKTMFVDTTNESFRTDFTNFSDTSLIADSLITGIYMQGEHRFDSTLIGTLDSIAIKLVVKDASKVIINAEGNLLINTDSSSASLNQHVVKGVLFDGMSSGDTVLLPTGSVFHYSPITNSLIVQYSNRKINSAAYGKYTFLSGINNEANDYSMAVGDSNEATGNYAIALGYKNKVTKVAIGKNATGLALGGNSAVDIQRAVSLGWGNQINFGSTAVAAGMNNTVHGAISLALGYGHTANGNFSACLGKNASTTGKTGALVMSDASSSAMLSAQTNHAFVARYSGGFFLYSDSSSLVGVSLASGSGAWSTLSDSAVKSVLQNEQDIPSYLSKINVYEWNYKGTEELHIGPISQQMYRITGLGESKKFISMVDADGVTLLEVKKLNSQINNHPVNQIVEIKAEMNDLNTRQLDLTARMHRLLKEIE